MWKQFVNDYLTYSYKDRTGIFVLLAFILLCILAPFVYPYIITSKPYDHSKFDSEMAKLQIAQPDSFNNKKFYTKNSGEDEFNDYTAPSEKYYPSKITAEIFYFDPNTASAVEWKRLGVRDKTIETIQKYLSKGGHFYKPEDISKIWGLHPADVKRLLPYVTIAQKSNDYVKRDYPNYPQVKQASYVSKAVQPVDVNAADTTMLIALPGIGSKLAQRIINFRNKLGGFYSAEQVGETFGLPDSTFQKIKSRLVLSNPSIKKININNASIEELKTHPYIRYAIANAIIQYRNQHGNFASVADVKKIMLVTDDVYKKMEPYVSVGE